MECCRIEIPGSRRRRRSKYTSQTLSNRKFEVVSICASACIMPFSHLSGGNVGNDGNEEERDKNNLIPGCVHFFPRIINHI